MSNLREIRSMRRELAKLKIKIERDDAQRKARRAASVQGWEKAISAIAMQPSAAGADRAGRGS